MYRGMRFEHLGKKLIHFHRSCSRYAEIPPGILSFPRRTEGRRISIARIRFLNKRSGVCSAQGTGEDSTGGSRLSNATRVLLYSRRKLREKWGEVGSTEFRGRAERIRAQRERERVKSVANERTSRRWRRKRRSRFFGFEEGNDTRTVVVEEV